VPRGEGALGLSKSLYNLAMRRTDLMDTSEWAHRELVRRLRQLTPEQRLHMVIERVDLGLEMHRLAKARLHTAERNQK
jgi:hypothetical protein